MARILLAEDDREIANLERDYLEMSGHEVVIAPDGPFHRSRGRGAGDEADRRGEV